MRNPEIFQGEKYLKKNKNYFEGWYFKNTNKGNGISFIPGINIDEKERKAFVQVITKDSSYYINYNINEFYFSHSPFYIKIGKNNFSQNVVHIDINDKNQKLNIYGDIIYLNNQNIKQNWLNPNIMGPFSYLPFMECNHAILCMKCDTKGKVKFNKNEIDLENGSGYIEKDWGGSFPKSYIWCQGNNFKNKNVSFMISIANIPFKIFDFTGVICVLKINNKEYKFTTYNNAKIINYENDRLLNITLKKGCYEINIKSNCNDGMKLLAPVKGKMEKEILENIDASVEVILKKDNKVIYSDTSLNCGLEIVR